MRNSRNKVLKNFCVLDLSLVPKRNLENLKEAASIINSKVTRNRFQEARDGFGKVFKSAKNESKQKGNLG